MIFHKIIEKLKDILSNEIDSRNVLDQDVADALNIDRVIFRKQKSRNTTPYYEIMQFLAKRKISINWFFFGQLPESLVASTSNYVLLKYNNSTFKAGSPEDSIEPKYSYIILDNLFVKYLNIDHKTTELIIVTGDSMEPTIKDNTMVFIDKKIEDDVNGIYAFETPQGLFVKRLELYDGIYKVISDNDEYKAQYSLGKDFTIIGKVTGQLGRV